MYFLNESNSIKIGPHLRVSFQRTLRIPDDGSTYPLPPGLDTFPFYRVADYRDTVPAAWRKRGGYFFPMYQREAMWIAFDAVYSRPSALVVGVGNINAITGRRFHTRLNKSRQNYLVCPDQPWLDGIKAGDGFIKQFVAMPLGMGYTVEEQLTGDAKFDGLQFAVYALRPEFRSEEALGVPDSMCALEAAPMGLGAGGKMKQKIYPDGYGWNKWDHDSLVSETIHIANSLTFREITGEEPPHTPISAKMYTECGYPWYKLYDEEEHDVTPGEKFKKVKSIKEMDKRKGFGTQQDDGSIGIPGEQVKGLGKE